MVVLQMKALMACWNIFAGERLSPWVAASCIIMGLTTLFV